jgi:2Fe-2S ferredoxin
LPLIIFVSPDGARHNIDAESGMSVMKTAVSNLVPGIVGECGGEMSCATCHVQVDEDWAERFPTITSEEEEMLEVAAAEPTKFSRLSCQLPCTPETDGAIVYIPEEQ